MNIEPCRHKRCIYFGSKKKCKSCGRAYANKRSLDEVLLPNKDMYITKEDLSILRYNSTINIIGFGIIIGFSALILAAMYGVFR